MISVEPLNPTNQNNNTFTTTNQTELIVNLDINEKQIM